LKLLEFLLDGNAFSGRIALNVVVEKITTHEMDSEKRSWSFEKFHIAPTMSGSCRN